MSDGSRSQRMPAVIRRLPRFIRPTTLPIVGEQGREQFNDLADDFGFLDDYLVPRFAECDRTALYEQSRYRRQQLVLVSAGALGAVLGALEAAFDQRWWPSVLVTLVAVLSAVFAQRAQHGQSLSHYLDQRGKAERLRSMYFQYLVRIGGYAVDDRRQALRQDVAALLSEQRS